MDSEVIELVADDKPVEVEVDRDATELSVELRPVDSELMPVEVDVDNDEIELVADERPVDVDVESEATELSVELRPVDSELIELVADDSPVDVEVDNDATELSVELRPVDSELMPVEVEVDSDEIELVADERPVDVDVDSEATVLSVELRPVDSELIELVADDKPVDVEVDNDATELSVELNPVDNEVMPVDSDEIALLDDDTVVDSEFTTELVANSCEPLIASVLVGVIWPAATLVIWRVMPALGSPTLTVLVGLPPANVVVTPPTVPVGVGLGAAVTEPLPSATSPALLAMAFGPIATESAPSAWLSAAVEFAWKYLMPWLLMLSIAEPTLFAVDVVPFALYIVYDGAETAPVVGS
ncbi:hypothetical protein WJ20_11915 [Burkholderia vietnamiensis]|nr:hypothetical protein WJ20_11915 [Burkholderia vietnamiensis]